MESFSANPEKSRDRTNETDERNRLPPSSPSTPTIAPDQPTPTIESTEGTVPCTPEFLPTVEKLKLWKGMENEMKQSHQRQLQQQQQQQYHQQQQQQPSSNLLDTPDDRECDVHWQREPNDGSLNIYEIISNRFKENKHLTSPMDTDLSLSPDTITNNYTDPTAAPAAFPLNLSPIATSGDTTDLICPETPGTSLAP